MNFVFEKYLSALLPIVHAVIIQTAREKNKDIMNVVDVEMLTGICIYMCMNDFILITVIYNLSYLYAYIQRFYTDGGKKFSKLKDIEQ